MSPITIQFGALISLGAFLLFLVQPIAGKFILPWFGGGPSVWTTCMVFFQAALVAGYAAAHGMTRSLIPRRQCAVFLGALVVSLAFMPFAPSVSWKPGAGDSPALRILLLLTATLGLPFVALAATSPLLQRWHSLLAPGESTYRLFAWSNAGSLAALAAYPFLIEPRLTRSEQSVAWAGLLLLFVVGCAVLARRIRTLEAPASDASQYAAREEPSKDGNSRGTPTVWLTLSTLGSALLLAATNKICQDVASTPFLWILPLALYLISFIVVFQDPKNYQRVIFVSGFYLGLLLAAAGLFARDILVFSLHTWICGFTLLFGCVSLHGELNRLKPEPARLTSFYLCISAGGALGGILVGIVAPLALDHFYEFQITLLASAAVLAVVIRRDPQSRLNEGAYQVNWAWLVATWLIAALAFQQEAAYTRRDAVSVQRNFYGSLMVLEKWRKDPAKHGRVMQHGNIVHGVQHHDPFLRRQPTAYFGETSGGGLALRETEARQNRHIGVIGLGAGTLAAYGREGDTFRFYEIDPIVIEAARKWFTYIEDSAAQVEVVPGDARLSLEAEAPQGFDLLILDAFSSDAIPTHLLTREAFELYLSHLKPDGALALHLSNRHLNLPIVVWAAAHALGLETALIEDRPDLEPKDPDESKDAAPQPRIGPSTWMIVSPGNGFVERDRIRTNAVEFTVMPGRVQTWTDDYSALWPVLK